MEFGGEFFHEPQRGHGMPRHMPTGGVSQTPGRMCLCYEWSTECVGGEGREILWLRFQDREMAIVHLSLARDAGVSRCSLHLGIPIPDLGSLQLQVFNFGPGRRLESWNFWCSKMQASMQQ